MKAPKVRAAVYLGFSVLAAVRAPLRAKRETRAMPTPPYGEMTPARLAVLFEGLSDGVYKLDIRQPGCAVLAPEGGLIFLLPDGRVAVIWPDPNSMQIIDFKITE